MTFKKVLEEAKSQLRGNGVSRRSFKWYTQITETVMLLAV